MLDFWKRPKFWIGFTIILWLIYVLNANLEQSMTLFVLPIVYQPILRVSTIVFVSMVIGCLLTLAFQFMLRRRASKYAAADAAAPISNSSTIA